VSLIIPTKTMNETIYTVKARETIDSLVGAVGFSDACIPPTLNSTYALVQAIDGDVRICADGDTPTADKGFSLTDGSSIEVWGGTSLKDFLVIDDGGVAKLEVVYMGVA